MFEQGLGSRGARLHERADQGAQAVLSQPAPSRQQEASAITEGKWESATAHALNELVGARPLRAPRLPLAKQQRAVSSDAAVGGLRLCGLGMRGGGRMA